MGKPTGTRIVLARGAGLLVSVSSQSCLDGCMLCDEYLLIKLASSGILHTPELLLEASIEMAGKLAPGRRSGHGVNAGASVRHQRARIAPPPPGLFHARLRGSSAAPPPCLAVRGATAGWGAMDG